MGYSIDEIKGRRHSMFAEAEFTASPQYAVFWDALRRGEPQTGKFRRLGKNGKEVWIEAAYNPILDGAGKPYKVVKFAADITAVELARRAAEQEKADAAVRQQAAEERQRRLSLICSALR